MESSPRFKKSLTDDRSYRYMVLPNSLRCLLIHDGDTKYSSAALNVKVGSLCDPPEYSGLAHLCEHMLFRGTHRFPIEDDFFSFISAHGGSKNASTSATDTNYYFEVPNEAFAEALDKFAEFFKSPLFPIESISREIQAVDAEYKKDLFNEQYRLLQLVASHANPSSRINRFTVGCAETLQKPGIRDALLDFFAEKYSAGLMTVVLLGKESLSYMEKLAYEHFGSIRNKVVPEVDSLVKAYDSSNLSKLFKVAAEGNTLRIIWALADDRKNYKAKSSSYIAHLLRYAGPNSLLSYLNDQDLAFSLSVNLDPKGDDVVLLTLCIELTDQGLEMYESVIELVCAYVSTLKEKGPQEYFFDELAKMMRLDFDYYGKMSPAQTVCLLAETMGYFYEENIEDLLIGPYLFIKYDPNSIKNLLSLMVPENMLVIVSSEIFEKEATLVEKWYGTRYSVSDLPTKMNETSSKLMSVNGKVLAYPPPNVFIPKNTEVLPKSTSLFPKLLNETAISKLWYKQDHRFNVPKTYGYCRIWTNDNAFPYNPESAIFALLFLDMFFEYSREQAYMAKLAGMECELKLCSSKLTLYFSGFSESLPILVESYLVQIKEFRPNRILFQKKLQETINKALGFLKGDPYSISMCNYGSGIISFGLDTSHELQILRAFTFEKFVNLSMNWLKTTRLDWYISGNISEATAIRIVSIGEKLLCSVPLSRSIIERPRVIQIPPRTEYVVTNVLANENETSSCLISYFQHKPYLNSELHLWAMNELTFTFIKEPAFHYFRTQEELGYIVEVAPCNHGKVLGGLIVIQSCKAAPEKISAKVNEFIERMGRDIEKITEKEFAALVEAVCIPLRDEYMNLREESTCYWEEIVGDELMFNRCENLEKAIKRTEKRDLIKYFKEIFFESVRRYDYEAVCKDHLDENEATKAVNENAAVLRGNKRIVLAGYEEMRVRNSLYPDMYLINSREVL